MPDYRRSDMCNVIDEYVINPTYRKMLKLRYCEGMTYEQIAENTNYSTQHVKHVCKRYRDLLISRL